MADGAVGQDLVLVFAAGASNAGLSTVGYTLLNADGTTKQSRRTTGVTELGSGWYFVKVAASVWTAAGAFLAKWDIATVFQAAEDIAILSESGGGGGGGDPWATVLDGTYTDDEAGSFVQRIWTKVSQISAGAKVTLRSPVSQNGKEITVIQGDDYLLADGTAFQWTIDWDEAATGVFNAIKTGSTPTYSTDAVDVTLNGDGTATISVDVPRADSATLALESWRWAIVLTRTGDGDVTTPLYGVMDVKVKP